ncbi:hypothetical protein G3I46_08610, partial [Streptomyces coelicoflavus]|nr:hypothetical protein [Streptomyces coelicoflavus]
MLADAARRAAAHEEAPDATGSYRLHATEVPGPSGLVELSQALRHPPGRATAPGGTSPSSLTGTLTEPEEPHVA